MNRTCVIVVAAEIARFFNVEEVDSPRSRLALVEHATLANDTDLKALGKSVTGRVRTESNTNRGAGPVHPIAAQRERHRGELKRRFGREIILHVGEITKGWKEGTVVLVAGPQLLGLMRDPLRKALRPGIELKELAKDYAHLTPPELLEKIAPTRILPARRENGN